MQPDRFNTTTPCSEAGTLDTITRYLLIDGEGKIIFAKPSTDLFKDLTLPQYVRDLFRLCLPAFDAAFSTCLATGKSRSRLLFQLSDTSTRPVVAAFDLCPLPDNAFQVILMLQPDPAPVPPLSSGAELPSPAEAKVLTQLDPLFIRSQTLAQVGNFKFDFVSATIEWTPAMFQIYRLPSTSPALSYSDFLERIHPADRDLFLRQSQQATIANSPLKTEIRILRGDDTTGFIQVTALPCYNDSGQVDGVLGTVIDITSFKDAELRLQQALTTVEKVMTHSPDMLLTIDGQGRILHANHACTGILGYDPDEITNRECWQFIASSDLGPTIEGLNQVRAGFPTHNFQNYCISKDGAAVPVSWSAYWSEEEQNYFCVGRDSTERRQREIKIKESQQRYKSLFEHHPDPVYSLNLEGEFLTANQQVSLLSGYDPTTLIGKNFQDLIVPDLLPDTILQFSSCLQGNSRHYYTGIYDTSGNQIDLEVTNIPIIMEGQVTGVYGIAKDVTQIKKNREERRQLIDRLEQKNHNLEQFAYIVSHNLRAPVANILGLTTLFNTLGADTKMNAQVIENLKKSAENLDAIINGLNQILSDRFELNQPWEMVNLPALLASIENTLKEDLIRGQAKIEADFSALPEIKTLKCYLHNILLSLVRHALNHQNPNQPLVIKITTGCLENKNCLTIQDNSLFLMGHTKRLKPGTRPAEVSGDEKLHLIRTQAEALGEKVEMHADPVTGSTFKIYLKQ